MRLEVLRAFALSLPHTTVSEQWGGQAFKVEGKVFLHVVLDAATIESLTFKCSPDEFGDLADVDGIGQAPYFAKRHWVRVGDLLALPAAELERRIRRSFDLVVAGLPKRVQAEVLGIAVAPRFESVKRRKDKAASPSGARRAKRGSVVRHRAGSP